jgi:hypothetical protein
MAYALIAIRKRNPRCQDARAIQTARRLFHNRFHLFRVSSDSSGTCRSLRVRCPMFVQSHPVWDHLCKIVQPLFRVEHSGNDHHNESFPTGLFRRYFYEKRVFRQSGLLPNCANVIRSRPENRCLSKDVAFALHWRQAAIKRKGIPSRALGVYSLVTRQAKWKSHRNVIEDPTRPASNTCRDRQREEIG